MTRNHKVSDFIRSDVSEKKLKYIVENTKNVEGYGFGFKRKDGDLTDEVVIVFDVSKKFDEEDLDDADILPKNIDGWHTDVQSLENVEIDTNGDRGDVLRPIIAGVDGTSVNGTGCTFGGIFTDPNGDDVVLSNEHCFCPDDEPAVCDGEVIVQPGPNNGGTVDERIGEVKNASDNVDAAIATIDSGISFYGDSFAFDKFGDWEEPILDEWYVNNGRTHGHRMGQCILIGGDGTADRYYRGDEGLSYGGHSGSIWGRVDDDGVFHPVSLHYGSISDSGVSFTVNQNDIFDEFGNLVPVDNPGQPTPEDLSREPVHEAVIYRAATNDGDINFRFLTCNVSGVNDGGAVNGENFTIRLEDLNTSETLYETSLSNGAYDYTLHTTSIPENQIPEQVKVLTEWDGVVQTEQEYEEFNNLPEDAPFFDVTITDTNSPIETEEILEVSYLVENTGEIEGTQDISLEIDGVVEDVDSNVTLGSGNSTSGILSWQTSSSDSGDYTATVNSDDDVDSDSVSVSPPPFVLSNLQHPDEVEIGEEVTATVDVYNPHVETETENFEFYFDADLQESRDVTIEGESFSVESFEYVVDVQEAGEYDVLIFSGSDFIEKFFDAVEGSFFNVSLFSGPAEVVQGEDISVSANVENTGDSSAEEEIEYRIGGEVKETTTQQLNIGQSEEISFSHTVTDDGGTYTHGIYTPDSGEESSLDIIEPPTFELTLGDYTNDILSGEEFSASVFIENIGDQSGTQNINLLVDNIQEDSSEIALDSGEMVSETLTWQTASSDEGMYTFVIESEDDNVQDTFFVTEPIPPTFNTKILATNSPIIEGSMLRIEYEVENIGDEYGEKEVTVNINDEVVDVEMVDLEAKERIEEKRFFDI